MQLKTFPAEQLKDRISGLKEKTDAHIEKRQKSCERNM
jgi:hypothetical protein